MARQFDPDPSRRPAARPPQRQARPAAPPPSRGSATATVPPPAPPRPPQARPATANEPDNEEREERATFGLGGLGSAPPWAISTLVHVIVLLVMALIAGEAVQIEKPAVITSSPSDSDEEFSEFEEQGPPLDSPPDSAPSDSVVAVAVTDVPVVEPVEAVSLADDVDAAPLAVELTDFGTELAPASDMMSTVGALGGKGGGLGGRGANAGRLAAGGGGGKDTEDAVDRALKWIADHQMPDGGWSFNIGQCPSCMGKCGNGGGLNDRGAATAMALLPFLGRGYTHTEGPYKKQVEGGIGFLVRMAMANQGQAYDGSGTMYSQGLAGIALSECYAMSQDSRLAAPTQYVLDFIMNAQDPNGGGWRYRPREAGDTSAVGWQIMALKSGNMAYLKVNPLTIKKAIEFLDSVQGPNTYGGTYGYTGPGDGPTTSAVGLLCRMYLGWKKDHPGIVEGTRRLAQLGPNNDLYYDYYATQVMHHMEGELWTAWNAKMKKMLLDTQSTKDHEAGSWFQGVEGGHGGHSAGRLYCTSLATMILEVYYRHLPIYRNQSVTDEFRE